MLLRSSISGRDGWMHSYRDQRCRPRLQARGGGKVERTPASEALPVRSAFAILATVIVTACTAVPSAVDNELLGSWVATTGNPAGVVAVFNGDGTFTWSALDLAGTYTSDGSSLTFSYPEDSAFCAAGTLTWDYEVAGDTLTADIAGSDCPDVSLDRTAVTGLDLRAGLLTRRLASARSCRGRMILLPDARPCWVLSLAPIRA